MSRPTRLVQLIALPTVSASENVSFATSLERRAALEPLPVDLQKWLANVAASRELLEDGVARQANTPSDARPERIVVTDNWSAIEGAVASHLKVKDHPSPARKAAAQAVHDAVFAASGLSWLAGTTHEEVFGTSASLLKVLVGPALAPSLATLGIPDLVAALQRAHERFGQVAGITQAPENADVAGLMEELRDDIRRYLGKVIAWAEDGEAERAIADRILQPWADWEPDIATAASPVAPAVPGAPAAGSAPGVPAPATSDLDNPFTVEDE